MATDTQYVTLVAEGGSPIRLSDQYGAPYPTTGYGELVFARNPTLYNPHLIGVVYSGGFGLEPGTALAPAIFFLNDVNTGIYSGGDGMVSFTSNGQTTGWFATGGDLHVVRDVYIGGTVKSGTWEGFPVDVAHGGTGANNASDARANLFIPINDGGEWVGEPIDIEYGGTNATTAAQARINLGIPVNDAGEWTGEPIDIAHGGTGAENATDALENLGVPVFSILNYGAVADGDGQGNGTDNTAAITAAFAAAVAASGGVVLAPPSGTNIYNAPLSITGDYSNITLLGQGGATFDVTNNPSLSHSIQALGAYGGDRAFTVQANMGDRTITLASTAGMVPGTILQLSSTIDCLSADVRAGVWENADVAKWRLGNATGSVDDITPYSEFGIVKSVLGNVVTLTNKLYWRYPIVAVPSWGTTTVSVARIVTPVKNFWVKDLNFTRYDPVQVVDGAHIIMFRFTQNSGMVGGTYDLGQRGGAAGRFYTSIDTLQAVRTTHTVGYDPDVQHDVYNSSKFSGCLRHKTILDDINGSQGADESYLSAQYAPYNTVNMFCSIEGKSEGNLDGWTSHGGSYGLTVGPFTSVNCARAFFNRACYATISNVNAYNAWNDTTAMGAFSFGAFGTNVTVSDSNVYGSVVRGIQIDRKVLDEIAPSYVGIKFKNVNVYDAPVGAYLAPTTTESNVMTATVANPGIIAQSGGTGIYYGCAVYFTTTGSLPVPLALNTLYYVKEKLSASTFTISATLGGSAINITDAGTGVLTCNWTDASDQSCGVSFDDCDFARVTGGVWATAYWNYVSWLGGSMELTGTTPIGYVGFANAIGHKVRNATFIANDPAALGIQVAVPSGTIGNLVFPVATFPTIRTDFGQFGSQTNTLVGIGRLAFFASSRNLYNNQTGETYSFQLWDCWQTVTAARTSTTQTLTLPFEGSGAGEVLWPVGAEIEIVNSTNNGNVNPVIAAAVGVTISAPQGLVIPFGSRAYLKRFGTNAWRLAIVTSAQITGAAYVDVGRAIGGSDTADFVPLVNAYFSAAPPGKHHIFGAWRNWVSLVRPTPQINGGYILPPSTGTLEWEPGAGSLWNFTAYGATGTSTNFIRPLEAVMQTKRPLVVSGVKGALSVTMVGGQAAGLVFNDRVRLRNTFLFWNLTGAFTLIDAPGIGVTASIASDGTMTVTAADSTAAIPIVGTEIVGPGVDVTVTAFISGTGGTGTYMTSPTGLTVGSQVMAAWSGLNTRGEDLIVKEVVGNTVHFLTALQDNYDITALPILERYSLEPELTFINTSMQGVGELADDRAIFIGGGKNINLIGGEISAFTQGPRIFGSSGGRIDGLTLNCTKESGAGGGISIGGTTQDFVVQNVTTNYGAQPVILTGILPYYGISRRITFDTGWCNAPTVNGPSTHSTSEHITFRNWTVNDPGAHGFDVRTPYTVVDDCEVNRAGNTCVWARFSITGLRVTGLRGGDNAAGVVLTNLYDIPGTQSWDYVPDNIEVSGSTLRNTGTGGNGAINLSHEYKTGGVYPVLGKVSVTNNFISMRNNAPAITVKGRFTAPYVANNEMGVEVGAVATGISVYMNGPDLSTSGEGPSDPMAIGNVQSAGYNDPVLRNYTGKLIFGPGYVNGVTSSLTNALTADTTLRVSQTGESFSTEGATTDIDVYLPDSVYSSDPIRFTVLAAHQLQLLTSDLSSMQIGTGVRGLNLRSSTVGAWAEFSHVGDRWMVEVDDPANWAQDWSPYSVGVFTEGGKLISWYDVDNKGSVQMSPTDPTKVFGFGDVVNDFRFLRVDDATSPTWSGTVGDPINFNGTQYLRRNVLPPGMPSGAAACVLYVTMDQDALVADVTTRQAYSYGQTVAINSRAVGRTVSGGVNRAYVTVGDGTVVATTEVTVNFTGKHSAGLVYDGANATAHIDAGVSAPIGSVATTSAFGRITLGADSAAVPTLFTNGSIFRALAFTGLTGGEVTDLETWLATR